MASRGTDLTDAVSSLPPERQTPAALNKIVREAAAADTGFKPSTDYIGEFPGVDLMDDSALVNTLGYEEMTDLILDEIDAAADIRAQAL